jgi:hypothetical protein
MLVQLGRDRDGSPTPIYRDCLADVVEHDFAGGAVEEMSLKRLVQVAVQLTIHVVA